VSSGTTLEERHAACKRKGRVDFAIFNNPQLARRFKPIQQQIIHMVE
jgi:hypothetical protein